MRKRLSISPILERSHDGCNSTSFQPMFQDPETSTIDSWFWSHDPLQSGSWICWEGIANDVCSGRVVPWNRGAYTKSARLKKWKFSAVKIRLSGIDRSSRQLWEFLYYSRIMKLRVWRMYCPKFSFGILWMDICWLRSATIVDGNEDPWSKTSAEFSSSTDEVGHNLFAETSCVGIVSPSWREFVMKYLPLSFIPEMKPCRIAICNFENRSWQRDIDLELANWQ
jgi:hypothetical protein